MKNFLEAYIDLWRNIFNFRGRTDYHCFWRGVGCHIALMLILTIPFRTGGSTVATNSVLFNVILCVLYIPVISAMFRRFRDSGRSWVNVFWYLLPIIGWFILIKKLSGPSVKGDGSF